ncbi:MAG: YbaB/EbfC family nucleoid-associated protein [Acidimicrobiales bacterium]
MSEPFDMGALLAQAQAMQERLLEAQAEAAELVVEGSAGGGAVRVSVTGDMRFTAVRIDPAAVDLGDLSLLEDLVLAACNDAVRQAGEASRSVVGDLGLGSGLLGGMAPGGEQ